MNTHNTFSNPCFNQYVHENIQNLMGSALENLGLANVFEFLRVFDDGRAVMLYSNKNLAQYVVTQHIPVTVQVPLYVLQDSFWYMPCKDSGSFQQHIKLVQDMQAIVQASCYIDYVVRQPGYYDMYCFFSPKTPDSAANQFLNLRDKMQHFCLEFYQQAEKMILDLCKTPLQLPECVLPNFKGLDNEQPQNPTKNLQQAFAQVQFEMAQLNKSQNLQLTERELHCVQKLTLGKTAKDIASELSISHRTVELFLNSARRKLKCHHKSDIINKIIHL